MNKHVVLIGLNYQPRRSTGDKNFWVELIPLLAKELEQITILSVRQHPNNCEEETVNGCQIHVEYLPPKFLETPDGEYRRPRIFWTRGVFPRWLGVIEKQLNIRRLVGRLSSICKENPFRHIHLMDNLGPGNRLIARMANSLGCSISISVPSYNNSNSVLYERYLRLSYNIHNVSLIPFSSALKAKLFELGLHQEKIIRIPWGVSSDNSLNPVDKFLLKQSLGFSGGKPLFLWAGYIQQIQRDDFLLAVKQARVARAKGLEASFYFAFKPETMEKGFESFHRPDEGIHVGTSDVRLFSRLMTACDIFYSPVITNKDVILAPPLTWIEIMVQGVPILTTDVPGASEIVENEKTGYLAEDEHDLMEKMFVLSKGFSMMKQACIEKVQKDYDIQNTAKEHLRLWLEREGDNDI